MVQETETDCYQKCSIRSPCEHHLQIIKSELGENDERFRITENILFHWMDCQPHFPKNYDKSVVRNFLRGSKHNMDRAKQKLEYHFKAKSYFPEIFSRRQVSKDLIDTLNAVKMTPLPKLTKDGSRVFILKISETDSDKIDFNLIPKAYFMIYDVLLRNPNPAAKEVAVFDCEGTNAAHLMKLLGMLKTMIPLLRQAYAMRLKELHFINAHSGIEKCISIVKPILHPKVKNSVSFHEIT
nr:retinaldehyde-binding protein 1-like [Leptinotarsa decemlineata]